jgi:hypothetical protein
MARTKSDRGASRAKPSGKAAARMRARRRRTQRSESVGDIITRLLRKLVPMKINGETTKVPAMAAIILQLRQKAMSGSIRASRVLLNYHHFAIQTSGGGIEITFVDDEYTTAFAMSLQGAEHD